MDVTFCHSTTEFKKTLVDVISALTMESTSCKRPGWMKHKLESRLAGEISITSDMQMTPPLWQRRGTKEPLDEGERGVKKLA